MVKAGRLPANAGRYLFYLRAEERERDLVFTYRVFGEAAKRLGIHGQAISHDQMKNLAQGLTADGKTRLGRRHRYGRWGTELVMSAPSTVSMAGQVLDDRRFDAMNKAVGKAAHDAMAYLERHAAVTRVTENGVRRREPVGLAYAVFVHAKNRNGEINLHAHVVVFASAVRANGQWVRIENRHVYLAQKATRRVFDQALAYHLGRDVGLKVVRRGESIGVKGVDREWAKTTRREDVKRERKRAGRTDAKGSTRAALDTRKPKEQGVPFAEVRRRWREAAHATGRYAVDLGTRAWTAVADAVQQRRADRCYRHAAAAVASNATRFPPRHIDEAAAFLATGRNVPPEALARSARALRDEPARFGVAAEGLEHGRTTYTSARTRLRQEQLVAELSALAGKRRCGLSDRRIANALAGSATASEMADVRRLAVRSGAVVGVNHSVNDPALAHAVTAYRRNGRQVFAVAAAPHVADVRRRLGVTTYTASDLAERLVPPSHWRCLKAALRTRGCLYQRAAHAERLRKSNLTLPRKCVVVIDAGLDQAAELRTIVRAVRRAGGKLVFTGPHSAALRERMDRHEHQHERRHDRPQTRTRGRSR